MRARIHHGLALALSLTLAACASQAPNRLVNLPGSAACIFAVTVSDWSVLDDSTLLVHAPLKKDAYLVKLFQPITGLRFHETLGFEDGDHNGQLCSTGDELLVGGEIPQRVPIAAIRLLSAEQEKQLRAAVGS